jgi:large subunit ribosomal protein L24
MRGGTMKIKKGDEVLVISGKDRGKTGKVDAVIRSEMKVVVDGINIAKRHTKPSNKQPRGGILEIPKPIDSSNVMVIDPATGLPGRISYRSIKEGKERVFKTSRYSKPKKAKE